MANGRCRRHGGPSTGAPKGNQNARTHGLFAKSLDPVGAEVYEAARDLASDRLAGDTAEFLLAQVAQAFAVDADLESARGAIAEFLRGEVEAENIDPKAAERILRRLATPDLPSLGKALGPLKGLLELRQAGAKAAGGVDGNPDVRPDFGSLDPAEATRRIREAL